MASKDPPLTILLDQIISRCCYSLEGQSLSTTQSKIAASSALPMHIQALFMIVTDGTGKVDLFCSCFHSAVTPIGFG